MSNSREELYVSYDDEKFLINKLSHNLTIKGFNSSNTVVVTVSTDYSSIIGQTLRHMLSVDGEICDGFGVDVPYPDETWDEQYVKELNDVFELNRHKIKDKRLLLVEARVIRGGNYAFLDTYLNDRGITDFWTLAMFENMSSAYKSSYVGRYYDNTTQDLTFWWERDNNHWK
jgi:hypothetical protein